MEILALLLSLIAAYSVIRILHAGIWEILDPYVSTKKSESRKNALETYPIVGIVSFVLFLIITYIILYT